MPDSPFKGMLTEDSPMRKIFPDGMVPLTTPLPQRVRLGQMAFTSEVYFIDLTHLTADQLEAMAQDMAGRGLGTIDDARASLKKDKQLPARVSHFNGTSFPLRFIT